MAEDIIQYPDDIFNSPWCDEEMNVKRAYRMGLIEGSHGEFNPSAFGFSNLTEAIFEKVEIDWSQLDGREVIAKHKTLGSLQCKLERDGAFKEDHPLGWWNPDSLSGVSTWGHAMQDAWRGSNGWTLWIKGEVPIKKRMASELPPLTHFKGRQDGDLYECIVYQSEATGYKWLSAVRSNGSLTSLPPHATEVVEVYGE